MTANASRTERYTVYIDESIETAEQLFERWTETIYLGFSQIGNWDAFEELVNNCFEWRDIEVELIHADISRLGMYDLEIYDDVLRRAIEANPGKLTITTVSG